MKRILASKVKEWRVIRALRLFRWLAEDNYSHDNPSIPCAVFGLFEAGYCNSRVVWNSMSGQRSMIRFKLIRVGAR